VPPNTRSLRQWHMGQSVLALVEERCRAEGSLKRTETRMAFAAAATDAGLWECEILRTYLWRVIVVSLLSLFLLCLPATAANPARILIINAWDDIMPAAVRRHQTRACRVFTEECRNILRHSRPQPISEQRS
jgi:hypothetical protein